MMLEGCAGHFAAPEEPDDKESHQPAWGPTMKAMNTTDCTTCREALPDLLFEPGYVPGPEAAHLAACPDCRAELADLRATFALMSEWTAPEPTPYFDSRVRAHLREAIQSQPEGLWERIAATLRFSTGRGLRPALAGALLFILLLGGGTIATIWEHNNVAPAASPAVNDLRIIDNNAQAIQQMDLLDEPGSEGGSTSTDSSPGPA